MILVFYFSGGIRLSGSKKSRTVPLVHIEAPLTVSVPLVGPEGRSLPIVTEGEHVLLGQTVARSENGFPVHASVCGEVAKITDTHITITRTASGAVAGELPLLKRKITDIPAADLIAYIRDAGIIDTSGTPRPAYEKILRATGHVSRFVLNCAESEPQLAGAYRLLLEKPREILAGAKILLTAIGLRRGVIAMEKDKLDVIETFQKLTAESTFFAIKLLRPKYPAESEHRLASALFGKTVSGDQPVESAGIVTFSPETCLQVYTAFADQTPSIRKTITVSGDGMPAPRNLSVPIGTSFADVLQACGLRAQNASLLDGGMMNGTPAHPTDVVTKTTRAITVLSAKKRKPADPSAACIRCGRCADVCSERLLVPYLLEDVRRKDVLRARVHGLFACDGCGCCDYVCPASIPIAKLLKEAKQELTEGDTKDE